MSRFEDYEIRLLFEDDGSVFAEVVELPGCMAAGHDPNNAVMILRSVFMAWVAATVDAGEEVPLPNGGEKR